MLGDGGAGAHRMAVVVVDVVGSVAAFQAFGNDRATGLITAVVDEIAAAVERHGPQILKRQGDGAIFVAEAPEMALGALDSISDGRFGFFPDGTPVRVHAAAAWADGVVRDGDVYGDAINLASRLAALARAGEVLADGNLVASLGPEREAVFELIDVQSVKGFIDPVRIYRLSHDAGRTVVFRRMEEVEPVRVLELDAAGLRIVVGRRSHKVVVGRLPGLGVVFEHGCVSREHATIEAIGANFSLADHSTNGTYLRDEETRQWVEVRRRSIVLPPEGEMRFGRLDEPGVAVRFVIRDAAGGG